LCNTVLHPFNGLLSWTTWVSWYQKGKSILDFNQEMIGWQWDQLDHMHIICTSYAHQTSSLNFYGPDSLPAAQPTVSKH